MSGSGASNAGDPSKREAELIEQLESIKEKDAMFKVKASFPPKSLTRRFNDIIRCSSVSSQTLYGDFISGCVLTAMVIPQSLAYAKLAALPVVYGLYTTLLPPIVYFFLGSSRHIAVGPLSVPCLLMGSTFRTVATSPDQHVGLCFILSGMVGLVMVVLGVFRMGGAVRFLSRPILSGFMTAAVTLTMASQVQGLLGYVPVSKKKPTLLHEYIMLVVRSISTINWPTFVVSLCGFGVVFGMKAFVPKLALLAPLVIVAGSLVGGLIFDYEGLKIDILGSVPSSLQIASLPSNISRDQIMEMIPAACFISFLGYIETIAIGKKFAKQFNYKVSPNKELVAIGLGNLSQLIFNGYPAFGGICATSANVNSGGQSPLAVVFRSLFVFLVVLFFTKVFYYLPSAILSVIVVNAVYKTIDIEMVKYLWKVDRKDLSVWVLGLVLTLFVGIYHGMGAAVGLSLLIFVYRTTRADIQVMGQQKDTGEFRSIADSAVTGDRDDVCSHEDVEMEEAKSSADVVSQQQAPAPLKRVKHQASNDLQNMTTFSNMTILTFNSPLWYANAELLKDSIDAVLSEVSKTRSKGNRPSEQPHCVVLDMSNVQFVDASAIMSLQEIIANCTKAKVWFVLCRVAASVQASLLRAELIKKLQGCLADSNLDAVEFFPIGIRSSVPVIQKALNSAAVNSSV